MNYVEDNVTKNETLSYRADFSLVIKKASLVIFLITLILAIVMIMLAGTLGGIFFVPLAIITLGIYLNNYMYIRTTELAVTDKRVIGRRGSFSIETIDIPIEKIQNIRVQQDLLSRFYDSGTIIIETGGKTDLKIVYVKNPYEFKKAVFDNKE